jgi:K(+)-stimulated pyrophosphate-energized sodium pump
MNTIMIYLPIVMAIIGLLFMWIKRSWVKKDAGDGKMKEISDYIYEGALAFLKAEYRLLAFFVVGASIVLAGLSYFVPTTHIFIVVAFVFGAFFLGLLGIWE